MMDLVVIDHEQKTIQVYDLKVTWAVESFYKEYYLYRRAYIQAYLYYNAAHKLKNDLELSGYKVLYPKFIVSDSINYYEPLIYTLSDEDISDAFNGFDCKGKFYPGVKDIIEDLNWSMDMNIWNISRKNYLNNGIVNIKE